jgi:hypothetical protein
MFAFWVEDRVDLKANNVSEEHTAYIFRAEDGDSSLCFSETLIGLFAYKSTLRQNPEEHHGHLHRRENHNLIPNQKCYIGFTMPGSMSEPNV